MHLEDFNEGALFSNLTEGPYPLVITVIMLALDSVFYVLLAVYLDQVIPGMWLVTVEILSNTALRGSFNFLSLLVSILSR